MLEPRDFQMIREAMTEVVTEVVTETVTEIVAEAVKPIWEEIRGLHSDVTVLQKEVKELRSDVTVLQKEVKELRSDVTILQKDMTNVKLVLENELQKGINIIGEGHIDLNRKLDLALEIREEREMMKLRILRLEMDMRCVKERLETA